MSFIRGLVVTASLCAAGLLAGPGSALAAGGGGALAFSTGPQSAVIDQPITGATINPSGPPITVRLLDDSGNLRTRSDAPVTISIGRNPAEGVLGGATTVDAVDGIATFRDLTINRPAGGYTLLAASPGLTGVPSDRFDEYSAAAVCRQNESCHTDVSSTTSNVSITANPASGAPNAAILTESLDTGTTLQCQGYTARDANWFTFVVTSANRSKRITYRVAPSGPQEELVGGTEFCFGSPTEFTTLSGNPAAAGKLPNGMPGFIGLLPFCKTIGGGPCVDNRSTTADEASPTGFDVVLKVIIPAGIAGDPWCRM